MKRLIVMFFLVVASGLLFAQQNLVPNPSFELLDSCPDNYNQIWRSTYWDTLRAGGGGSANGSGPDLCAVCCTDPGCEVPYSSPACYQYPRTGQVYAATIVFYTLLRTNEREYIQSPLTRTLTPGKTYCVVFYVNLSNRCKYACDGMGAYFDDGAVNSPFLGIANVIPQISNASGNVITDTLGWVPISGTFVANGTENYISIGNFIPDNQLTIQNYNPSAIAVVADYEIEDVSVVERQDAQAGNDTTICVGKSLPLGTNNAPWLNYYWSPTTGLDDPYAMNPNARPLQTTTYHLVIADTTQLSCLGNTEDSVTVFVKQDCPEPIADLILPSLLYGNQELLLPHLQSESTLEIFDTEGRLVYKKEDYQGGFFANTVAQDCYVIRLTSKEGISKSGKMCTIK